jgi:SNF2 family DNA or RNA helicase
MEVKLAAFQSWLKKAGLSEKKHQISGLRFCLERECGIKSLNGVKGGIIADEMGLGKTILMLGCIVSNFKGDSGKTNTLVVLPLALLDQWKNIFERFMGHIPLVYHGAVVKEVSEDELKNAPVVLTTYGMIAERMPKGTGAINPRPINSPLWSIQWNRVVMDEAHHVRNMDTGTFRGARMLRANIRWLVTGTPIQNKASDFYALCSVLGFEEDVYTDMVQIRQIIRTHLLKRTKKQVGIQLPPIQAEEVVVPWSSDSEKNIAKQIHSHAHFSNVTVENVDDVIGALARGMPMLTRARQVCVFPHLLNGAVRRLQERGVLPWDVGMKRVKTCSKMTAVAKHILNGFKLDSRRKIVFCHYRGEIDLLKGLLTKKNIVCATIDGRTTKNQREQVLDRVVSYVGFSKVCRAWRDSAEWMYPIISSFIAPQVLIVQIQTANEGLNLQHYQDIYFTSPHWNPAVEEQAIARAHRIGQTERVQVYRFIMEEFDAEYEGAERPITIDQYCQIVQNRKREAAKMLDE